VRRRGLIRPLGGAAASWPLPPRGQMSKAFAGQGPLKRKTARDLILPIGLSLALIVLTSLVLAQIHAHLAELEVWHDPEDLALAYLLPTLFIAVFFGSTVAVIASLASGVAAAYFIYPPQFSFLFDHPHHIAELGFILVLGITASKAVGVITDDKPLAWRSLRNEAEPRGWRQHSTAGSRFEESIVRHIVTAFVLLAVALGWSNSASAQAPADIVLLNGKIVTVDDRFTIAEALAIKGERILAVGTNVEIEKHKGPLTRVLDLGRRTVIPGLIDNHAHYMRAAEYWHREVRLDGVTSHKEALELIKQKAAESKPGEWVVVLGGWSEEQFVDEPRGFNRAELDGIAPENPVGLQLFYFRVYANTAALKAMGIDANTPDPSGIKIEKDEKGQPTGALNGGPAIGLLRDKLGEVARNKAVENARLLMRDLNKMGITAFQDQGGTGMKASHIEAFRIAHDSGQMTVRSFYNYYEEPRSAADVDNLIARMGDIKPFQGDDWFDLTGYGETLYFPLHDALLAKAANPSADALKLWQRLGLGLAQNSIHLNVHAQLRGSIEGFLTAMEAINKERPIKGLRWTFSHLDQVQPQDLERMKRLDIYAQIHSRPTIQGMLMLKVHGDLTYDMPPLRMIQDSGIPWGLGSDATAVTPSSPFTTLWWAVTGKMIGGRQVLRQTISREEALIAHTRANAVFLFQEANLGSLAPGKYADLLVLDRDYLTVPADEILAIKPLLTMVGGKPVYDAMR
jgi:predicted amidohydrolase YtcJ